MEIHPNRKSDIYILHTGQENLHVSIFATCVPKRINAIDMYIMLKDIYYNNILLLRSWKYNLANRKIQYFIQIQFVGCRSFLVHRSRISTGATVTTGSTTTI